ncbi:ABC transporter permease [Streptomyces sp. NBC_00006]|uniref:ABC transporter permease n=1 Tax=unclassified Streptomyces TaxID=2593676 RepID=UPI0022528360|nr:MULTISPECIES: ABC transporter permease [unclassified Streptomyces]MCX4831817.1 ABC transporter permease [Streptomyces sp. NBC_01016]MCX5536339.1 ABC transporter permease [Streptomyces sp. NBC_00006]
MKELPETSRLRGRDLVAVGLDGLRGRPLRAVLSALGIAIGVAAMVALVGLSSASRAGLMAEIEEMGTNLLTAKPGTTLSGDAAKLPTDAEGMVSRIPGVTGVSGIGLVEDATVRRTDKISSAKTSGVAVQATRTNLLKTLSGTVRSGAFLNSATSRYPSVVLGADAADRLGIDRADANVFIGGQWFLVVGILDELPLAPEIDRSALIGWPYAARLGFDGHVTSLYERSTDATVSSVRDVLGRTINPKNPEEVQVSRPSDALTAQAAAEETFNALFFGLGAIALLAGGVGIANIMVISVLERRQEIGLRRSLGATRGQIRMQFLTESVSLSALGGAAGVVIGLGACLGYALYRDWPLTLPGQAIAGGALAAVAIGAVAGIYPARRAAGLTPTEALATT